MNAFRLSVAWIVLPLTSPQMVNVGDFNGSGRPVYEPEMQVVFFQGKSPKSERPEARKPNSANLAQFRRDYDRDVANARRQSWEQYRSWVKVFYEGNALDSGWNRRTESLLQNISNKESQSKTRIALNNLGRRLAAEWSKDNNVRRVNTGDLTEYGARLTNASQADREGATKVLAEIDAIDGEVSAKLKAEARR